MQKDRIKIICPNGKCKNNKGKRDNYYIEKKDFIDKEVKCMWCGVIYNLLDCHKNAYYGDPYSKLKGVKDESKNTDAQCNN